MTDRDQLTSLRELLRDALEITRSIAAQTGDDQMRAACERSRQSLAAMLSDLDTLASRRSGTT